MPMFDLDNVKKADLEGNKTTSDEFLKMRGGDELRAINNEAGKEKKPWFRDVSVNVVAGLIVLGLTILLYYFYPKLK